MEKVKQIYQVFDPAPLRPDQSDLYVDLDDARGDTGIVNSLSQRILLSDRPTCQILAGHKGSGKSTELYRLKQELERQHFFVVLVDTDEDVDRNDVDFPDVLIAMLRKLAQELKPHGIHLKPGYFKDRLERLTAVLSSPVEFGSLELDASLAKLSATIKGSPDARLELRDKIEPDTGNWIDAANDLLGIAVSELAKKGKSGLAILIDDLDKMILRPRQDAHCSTGEYLFVHREAQLTAFNCHTVYTMPLALAYSQSGPTLQALYEKLPVVPMTKVRERPPSTDDFQLGMERFRQVITSRLAHIGARPEDLCDDATRDQLIRSSGGQPTELMYFVREALITTGLPITQLGLERAARERRRAYMRQLRQEHWTILQRVRQTGLFVPTEEEEKSFRELLDSRAILQYRNGDEWYRLNPVIEDLAQPSGV